MDAKDRKLFAATVVALASALLVIAFLLGRMSATLATGRSSAPPTPPSTVSSATVPAPPALPSAGLAPLSSETTATTPSLVPSSPGQESRNLAPTAAPAPNTASSSDRSRVAAYFAEAERLEEMGTGDPQAFAKSLMETITSGDFSTFDDLLAKAKGRRDRLRTLSPPKLCVDHHRLSLALATDSINLMERLKAALMKGDTLTLMTLSTDGRVLETQTAQVRAEAERVKRLVGL